MNALPLMLGGGEIFVLMGIFFLAAIKNWGGDKAAPNECLDKQLHPEEDTCFCEETGSWLNVKQRSNTWSNLVVTFAGAFMLIDLMVPASVSTKNPMHSLTFFSVLYGMLVIFLGPGSMFFHASLTKWGGWLDNFSMNLYISFVLIYSFIRLFSVNELTDIVVFSVLFVGLNIIVGIYTWKNEGTGTPIFIVLIFVTFILACIVNASTVFDALAFIRITRGWTWLIVTFLVIGLSFYVWSRSETGGPLCRPDNPFGWFSPTSIVQGHAIWHIINAIATVTIFLYLRTELLR